MAEQILLFYKYVDIEQPEAIREWQLTLCTSLGLKGRVLIAHEGINATLGGIIENTHKYIDAMNEHPLFGGIDFKTSAGSANDFPRLQVKIKREITRLGIDPSTLKASQGGKHLTPQEAHELIASKPDDLVILDARNNYESRIGRFEGSICPDIRTFSQFPAYIDEHLDLFKDKQVLMECTGGIRCERASAYLKEKGIAKAVYQIEGGIHRYAEQYPDGYFRGKNYVFDNRMYQVITQDVMTSCDWCQKTCDDLTSCINAECDKQYVTCRDCSRSTDNTCSPTCRDLIGRNAVRRRPSHSN